MNNISLFQVFGVQLDEQHPFISSSNIAVTPSGVVEEMNLLELLTFKLTKKVQTPGVFNPKVNDLFGKAMAYSLTLVQEPKESEEILQQIAVLVETHVETILKPLSERNQQLEFKRSRYKKAHSTSNIKVSELFKDPPIARKSSSGSSDSQEKAVKLLSPRLDEKSDSTDEDTQEGVARQQMVAITDDEFGTIFQYSMAKFRGAKVDSKEIKKFKNLIKSCNLSCILESKICRYLKNEINKDVLTQDFIRNLSVFQLSYGDQLLSFGKWQEVVLCTARTSKARFGKAR